MKLLQDLNFYEILEVSPKASQGEIRKAYERAKQTYSRDSIAVYSLLDANDLEEMSRLIERAYRTIGNRKRRREYDQTLGRAEVEETETLEPSFYELLSLPDTPLHPDETGPRSHEQEEKIREMISEPEFEYSGPALRKIRETIGLDLKQISRQTKVSSTNLYFIEMENYAHLPAFIYLKGFVSEYARCLGLDPLRVLNDYVMRYRKWEKEREMSI